MIEIYVLIIYVKIIEVKGLKGKLEKIKTSLRGGLKLKSFIFRTMFN